MFLYRANDSIAERIRDNLENISDTLRERRKSALIFKEGIVSRSFKHLKYNPDQGTCFRYSILVSPEKRDKIMVALRIQGIFCSRLYFPALHRLYACNREALPAAEYIADRILNFKVSSAIESEEINIINKVIDSLI